MHSTNYCRKLILFFTLSCLLTSQISLAQKRQVYTGPYQLADIEGLASFEFRVVEEDTVFDGEFTFHSKPKASNIQGTHPYAQIQGAFKNGKAVGSWSVKEAQFEVDSEVSKVGYTYRLLLSGKEHTANGKIEQQKAQGRWQHIVHQLNKGDIQDTLFSSTFDFELGIPKRSFEIRTEENMLAGRLIEEGVAHDQWELYSFSQLETAELWVFNEGRLEKIIISNEEGSFETAILPKTNSTVRWVNLDSTYLKTIALMHTINSKSDSVLTSKLAYSLKANEKHYQSINKKIGALSAVDIHTGIKVQLDHSPLAKEDKEALDKLNNENLSLYKRLIKMSESSQLNILERTEQEIKIRVAILNFYQEQYYHLLRQFLGYYKEGVFEYLTTDQFLKLAPSFEKLQANTTITYQWKDSIREHSLQKIEVQATSSEALRIFITRSSSVLNRMNEQIDLLDSRLEQQERIEELREVEEKLMASLDSTEVKIDSLQKGLNKEQAQVLKSIYDFNNASLSTYSNIQGNEAKIKKAKELITCFRSSEVLSKKIARLDKKEQEIIKLYTEDKWNPFTSTVMSELEKRRIVEAYQDKVIPFLLEKTQEVDDCNDYSAIIKTFEALDSRMLALKTEDTDKLERKLKSENDPMTILNMLGVKHSLKNVEP